MADDERKLIGVSKHQRQKVIEQLKQAYANDLLDEREFEKRLELATNTQSRQTLRALVEDLPLLEEGSSSLKTQAINTAPAQKSEILFGILGGVTRKGNWRPARRIRVIAFMGGIELDFTETPFPEGGIELEVFSLMGGIELRVPVGVNVEAHPLAIMGGVDLHGLGYFGAEAPTIRISGFVLMGGVDIKPPRQNLFKKIFKKFLSDD